MIVRQVVVYRNDEGNHAIRFGREYLDASQVLHTITKYNKNGWYHNYEWPEDSSSPQVLMDLVLSNGSIIHNVEGTPDEFYEFVMLAKKVAAMDKEDE